MDKTSVAGGSVSKLSSSGHIILIAVEMDRQNDALTIKEILYCYLFLVKKQPTLNKGPISYESFSLDLYFGSDLCYALF